MVSQGILKYTMHGMLGERQRQSLFFFLDVVSEVLQEHYDLVDLDKLEQKMNLALALVRFFGLSELEQFRNLALVCSAY